MRRGPVRQGRWPAPKGSITVIDLYTWTTPNGRKISILPRGAGTALYGASHRHRKDEQFKP